jgi:hypothetical protein
MKGDQRSSLPPESEWRAPDKLVMRGLVARIHDVAANRKTWIAVTSTAMTTVVGSNISHSSAPRLISRHPYPLSLSWK